MSLAKQHSLSNAASAFSMLGSEEVTLNGTVVNAICDEVDYSKDFQETGFKPMRRFDAVIMTADLPSGALLKKIALFRGESFRVDSMRKGAVYTTVSIQEIDKA